MNQHAPTVDVRDLQLPQLRIPHARGVQHHQHRAVRTGCAPRRSVGSPPRPSGSTADDGAPSGTACRRGGSRRFSVFTKKNRSADTWSRTVRGCQLPRRAAGTPGTAQVRLIEPVRRTVEVPREPLDRVEVVLNRGRRVVTPLEFVQHMRRRWVTGHLLVTHTLPDRLERASRAASAAPAASSKRRSVYQCCARLPQILALFLRMSSTSSSRTMLRAPFEGEGLVTLPNPVV